MHHHIGAAHTMVPETDHATHVKSQSCMSTSYIPVCLCTTAAYIVCKACAALINTAQPLQEGYHGQQLGQVIIFDDTLHVWSSLRVSSMPEFIYSSNFAAFATLEEESQPAKITLVYV